MSDVVSLLATTNLSASEETKIRLDQRWHEIVIVLRPSASISGFVECDGRRAPRVNVVARPFDSTLMQAAVIEALKSGDPRLTATTDQDGEFTIYGLRSSIGYELAAGGNGLISSSVRARSGESGVRLSVKKVFGLLVRHTEQDGTPLRLTNGPDIHEIPEPGFNLAGGLGPRMDSPYTALLGLPSDIIGRNRRHSVILQTGPMEAEQLGPIRYYCAILGYAHANPTLYLPPLSEGRLQVRDLPLTPEVRSKGTLTVDLDLGDNWRTDSGRFPDGTTVPLGKVLAYRKDADGGISGIEVLVHSETALPIVLDGLPVGEYRVNFKSSSEYLLTPVVETTVRAESVVRISVGIGKSESSTFGSVQLKFPNAGGHLHSTVATAAIRRIDAADQRASGPIPHHSMVEVGGEYVIHFVPPGRYAVRLWLANDSVELPHQIEVEVRPGERAIVAVNPASGW
ncbi:MAG: hypothetical protein JNJ88_13655 [Planctomycetes bacterium]|nr:hypothetical protein [Planctomycetota bacterium]